MYNELLKQHEEILKKLTDKASKETDFGERGQFINLQKMINNELDANYGLLKSDQFENIIIFLLKLKKQLLSPQTHRHLLRPREDE